MKRSIFLLSFLLAGQCIFSQDYIITWKSDTVYCRLPARPGKEGIRPASKYQNGHLRFLAFFSIDSVRVLEAGQVKGYYRGEHGSSLLCNGNFEARKMAWSRQDTSWYFMNRVVEGKHATLYMIYLSTGNSPRAYYFLKKKDDPDPLFTVLLDNRKHLKELLLEEDIKEGMLRFFSGKKRRKYSEAVKEYNQLKEEGRPLTQN